MTIAASMIFRQCVEALNDLTSVTWPMAELARHFNAVQRQIVTVRPDATATAAALALVAGTRQTIPNDGLKLIRVVRNTNGPAIRQIAAKELDNFNPGWHTLTGSTTILHYMFDPREPRVFYVYKPASVGASVDLVYGKYPADISIPAAGSIWSDATGNMDLPDIYERPLIDGILALAYMRDDENGNPGRAQSYRASFADALGIEAKATLAISPAAMVTSRGAGAPPAA
jgi:hypothetical protein